MSVPFFVGPKPRVFGHRGAAGLAPENTLPSFALGLTLGAHILELDVQATRDGEIVVFHDPTVERTTNGTAAVRELVLYELQKLDAGYHFTRDGRDFPYRGHGVTVPTLEALLREFPLAPCNIEIKQQDPPIVAGVVEVIRRLSAQHRILLAAENDVIMRAIREEADDIATSFSAAEVADFMSRVSSGGLQGYAPAGQALQIPPRFGEIDLVTPETVAAAHRCGLEVHVWTINQRDEMEQLLALGVDGIMSDLPGLARTTVDRYGS
jgi:glycerophosphoryl diester phosphodiesterase